GITFKAKAAKLVHAKGLVALANTGLTIDDGSRAFHADTDRGDEADQDCEGQGQQDDAQIKQSLEIFYRAGGQQRTDVVLAHIIDFDPPRERLENVLGVINRDALQSALGQKTLFIGIDGTKICNHTTVTVSP